MGGDVGIQQVEVKNVLIILYRIRQFIIELVGLNVNSVIGKFGVKI